MTQIDPRIRLKRTTISGNTPDLGPSSDHRDGSWDELDVYNGELYLNIPDKRLWIGTDTGVCEIPLGTTSGISAIPLEYGSTAGGAFNYTSVNPHFGNNEVNANYSSILGGQNNRSDHDNSFVLGSNITTDAIDTTFVERLDVKDGIQTDNVTLKTKVIDIGDWDMNYSAAGNTGVSISHGLTAADIRTISVLIRNDADNVKHTGIDHDAGSDYGLEIRQFGAFILIDQNGTASGFDSTDWDSTSYNRGWITITYVA